MLNPILTAHGFGKGGGGIEYKKVSTATALRDKQGVIADTSGGTFVVSLPNSPREGTQCSIVDGGDWSANPLTVDPVGAAIEGQPAGETLTLDIGSIEAQFVYTGTKWKVFVKVVSPSGNVVSTNGVQRLSNKTLETTNVDGDLSFTGQGRHLPNIGNIEWCLPDNTSSTTTRVAYITVAGAGSAANNRGAAMFFGTKVDGVAGGGNTVLTIDENGHTKPGANNAYDLGSTTLRWRNIYTQDLHLSNGIGDYTMIEGEEDLFLVNNKNGKHYKFALIQVDPSIVPAKSEAADGS